MDKKYEKISQDLGVTLKQIDTVLSLTTEGGYDSLYRSLSERHDWKLG